MGDLEATIELALYIHDFYNVDLFQRGYYQIRVYPRSSQKLITKVELSLPKANEDWKGSGNLIYPACIISGAAVSKTFQILYRNEEIFLHDYSHFKLHLILDFQKISDSLDRADLQLVVELWFSENSFKSDPNTNMQCVSSRNLHLHFSPTRGLHYHLPVIFDYFHLSSVSITIHATLITLHQPHISGGKGNKSSPKLMNRSQHLSIDEIFFGNLNNSISCGVGVNANSSWRLAQARSLHKTICTLLIAANTALNYQLESLNKLLIRRRRNVETNGVSSINSKSIESIGLKLGNLSDAAKECYYAITGRENLSESKTYIFGEKSKNQPQRVDNAEDFFISANNDIANICAENIHLWKHFIDIVIGSESIKIHLQKEHHDMRVKRFSEAFFVIYNSRVSAMGCYESNYQHYSIITEAIRRSRYFTAMPPLPVDCPEMDGDSTTIPIIFEDQYERLVPNKKKSSALSGKKSDTGLCPDNEVLVNTKEEAAESLKSKTAPNKNFATISDNFNENKSLVPNFNQNKALVANFSQNKAVVSNFSQNKAVVSNFSQNKAVVSNFSQNKALISQYSQHDKISGYKSSDLNILDNVGDINASQGRGENIFKHKTSDVGNGVDNVDNRNLEKLSSLLFSQEVLSSLGLSQNTFYNLDPLHRLENNSKVSSTFDVNSKHTNTNDFDNNVDSNKKRVIFMDSVDLPDKFGTHPLKSHSTYHKQTSEGTLRPRSISKSLKNKKNNSSENILNDFRNQNEIDNLHSLEFKNETLKSSEPNFTSNKERQTKPPAVPPRTDKLPKDFQPPLPPKDFIFPSTRQNLKERLKNNLKLELILSPQSQSSKRKARFKARLMKRAQRLSSNYKLRKVLRNNMEDNSVVLLKYDTLGSSKSGCNDFVTPTTTENLHVDSSQIIKHSQSTLSMPSFLLDIATCFPGAAESLPDLVLSDSSSSDAQLTHSHPQKLRAKKGSNFSSNIDLQEVNLRSKKGDILTSPTEIKRARWREGDENLLPNFEVTDNTFVEIEKTQEKIAHENIFGKRIVKYNKIRDSSSASDDIMSEQSGWVSTSSRVASSSTSSVQNSPEITQRLCHDQKRCKKLWNENKLATKNLSNEFSTKKQAVNKLSVSHSEDSDNKPMSLDDLIRKLSSASLTPSNSRAQSNSHAQSLMPSNIHAQSSTPCHQMPSNSQAQIFDQAPNSTKLNFRKDQNFSYDLELKCNPIGLESGQFRSEPNHCDALTENPFLGNFQNSSTNDINQALPPPPKEFQDPVETPIQSCSKPKRTINLTPQDSVQEIVTAMYKSRPQGYHQPHEKDTNRSRREHSSLNASYFDSTLEYERYFKEMVEIAKKMEKLQKDRFHSLPSSKKLGHSVRSKSEKAFFKSPVILTPDHLSDPFPSFKSLPRNRSRTRFEPQPNLNAKNLKNPSPKPGSSGFVKSQSGNNEKSANLIPKELSLLELFLENQESIVWNSEELREELLTELKKISSTFDTKSLKDYSNQNSKTSRQKSRSHPNLKETEKVPGAIGIPKDHSRRTCPSDLRQEPFKPELPVSKKLNSDTFIFEKAKEDLKKQLRFHGVLYSDIDNVPSTPPYFSISEERRVLSPDGLHLIICVHGLDGNPADLRLIKTYLEIGLPGAHLDFLMSERNQGDTFSDFDRLTNRLVSEIIYHIEFYNLNPKRISFVGHSLGNVIIRGAISHPQMKNLLPKLYSFLSLSGPHLGTMYNSSGLVNMGMWVMQKWKKSGSLLQLGLKDHVDVRSTYLYKLSQKSQLQSFKNILLCGSSQDRYVPLHSARIELCRQAVKDTGILGTAYKEMISNLLQPIISNSTINLVRFDVHHALPSTANSLIGRAAHIAVLDSELFIEKFLLVSVLKYFR